MSTKALPNYKDKKNRYYICVFLITAILAIKEHCYICAFMSTKVSLNYKDKKSHYHICVFLITAVLAIKKALLYLCISKHSVVVKMKPVRTKFEK